MKNIEDVSIVWADSHQMLLHVFECHDEIRKLRAVIETHQLCHNLHGKVDAEAFAEGCADEQRKHFGCAPHADRVTELEQKLDAADVLSRIQ